VQRRRPVKAPGFRRQHCSLRGQATITGAHDLLLGHIEGCPFYIDSALDNAWNTPDLILDVEDGEPEGFSLGPGRGQRFITRLADTQNLAAAGDQDLS
jgi:uncharacterized protein (DUF779 family)